MMNLNLDILKNGNFEKYKNSSKNQFMLTGHHLEAEDTTSFKIENIKNLDSGQYEFIFGSIFGFNYGSDRVILIETPKANHITLSLRYQNQLLK